MKGIMLFYMGFIILCGSLIKSDDYTATEDVLYIISPKAGASGDVFTLEPVPELKDDNYDFGLMKFKFDGNVYDAGFNKGTTEFNPSLKQFKERFDFKIDFGKDVGDALCISQTKDTDESERTFTCFARFIENYKEKELVIRNGTAFIGKDSGGVIVVDPAPTSGVSVNSLTLKKLKVDVEIKERERSKGMNKGGLIATPIVLVLALLGVVGFAFAKRKVEQDDKPDVEVNAEESTNQKANLHRSDADNYVDSKQPLKTFKKGKTTAY